MSWAKVDGGFQRTFTVPVPPGNLADCFGIITVTSRVNGDSVAYDTNGNNLDLLPDGTVSVVLPDEVVNRILTEGQAQIQLDVIEPTGARNTLLGGLFRVNASGTDLEPVVP